MYALTYASNKQAFYYYHYYYYCLSVIYNFETENNVLRGNGMFDELMHRLFGERDATYIISLYILYIFFENILFLCTCTSNRYWLS